MTTPIPITPPPELVQQWLAEPVPSDFNFQVFRVTAAQLRHLAARAAQYGADQELEACCKWLPKMPPWSGDYLRRHRRPKPPSLKVQARSELIDAYNAGQIDDSTYDTIRRALEGLPDE
jgi:hypothetical protein